MPPLTISTDKTELDVPAIHHFLSTQSTWAIGIPLATVQCAIEHSLCFGGYIDGRQVAFARVVTDCATFAYLVDGYVLDDCRGRGYARQLMDAVMAHPGLQGLRRFMLATSTAHGLYAQYGFTAPLRPASLMEKYVPDIYRQ